LLRPKQARSQEDQEQVSLHSCAQRSHLIVPGRSSASLGAPAQPGTTSPSFSKTNRTTGTSFKGAIADSLD